MQINCPHTLTIPVLFIEFLETLQIQDKQSILIGNIMRAIYWVTCRKLNPNESECGLSLHQNKKKKTFIHYQIESINFAEDIFTLSQHNTSDSSKVKELHTTIFKLMKLAESSPNR